DCPAVLRIQPSGTEISPPPPNIVSEKIVPEIPQPVAAPQSAPPVEVEQAHKSRAAAEKRAATAGKKKKKKKKGDARAADAVEEKFEVRDDEREATRVFPEQGARPAHEVSLTEPVTELSTRVEESHNAADPMLEQMPSTEAETVEKVEFLLPNQDGIEAELDRKHDARSAHEAALREQLRSPVEEAQKTDEPLIDHLPPAEAEPIEEVEFLLPKQEGIEAELARLRETLDETTRERDQLASQQVRGVHVKRGPSPEHAGLLSLANRVLFKRFSDAVEGSKDAAALMRELKKREESLCEAWHRRQVAEDRCVDLAKKVAQLEAEKTAEPTPVPTIPRRLIHTVLASSGAMLLAIGLLSAAWRSARERATHAEAAIALVKKTAPDLHNEALAFVDSGRFDEALDKITSALALAPEVADYHRTKGHIQESRLDVRAARISYRQALNLNPKDGNASANYDLCRRISGTRLGAASPESKYALHSLMFEQGRLQEARRMAERLPDDRRLQHQTWSALLKRANLEGELRLNQDGTFDLEVTRLGEDGLAIIVGMPLQSLKAARTGLTDLEALRGMELQRLDISGTRVRDLKALKGLPLEVLDISNTPIDNLAPLRGMRLTELVIDHTPVSDLS
ncbi:MAG TPA: hypothetical protein VF614_07480, partial [Chthoniobacteraceae bacterium]